ncbi:hypothetical protein BSKO_09445 [Bryopsis sp. KO-2023]|nr:hypothetical protein BSKO_09445 [Bryopsis sp. KO-2023]
MKRTLIECAADVAEYPCGFDRRRRMFGPQKRGWWSEKRLLVLGALVVAAIFLLGRRGETTFKKYLGREKRSDVAFSRPVKLKENRGSRDTLVLYAYFEKDDIQRDNLDFFLSVGVGLDSVSGVDKTFDYALAVSGEKCAPCRRLRSLQMGKVHAQVSGVSAIYRADNIWLVRREVNEGMDFASYNATISMMQAQGQLWHHKFFMFLNSSVRGPFFPNYLPKGFHWLQAFTQRLAGDVKIVGCSLVCLPGNDAGGFGPKIESWAFAVDREGLSVALAAGVFERRICKLCEGSEGVVVGSEYGLSKAIINAGFNMGTLLSRYPKDIDWRDPKNWNCNDNVHPSRHGTYDGISMHPYETLFVKTSWHVGDPFVKKYTSWRINQAAGKSNTEGAMDEQMYLYAIGNEAILEKPEVQRAYDVLSRIQS